MKARSVFKFTVLLLLIAGAAWGWYAYRARENTSVSYLTEPVRLGDVVQSVNAVGEVGAGQLVDVGAQVSGQIETLYVELGQEVRKGDRVADIDSTTQENELRTNQAKLKTYQAQLAAREIALRIAQVRYNREKKLLGTEATSKENFEDAENNLALAKAEVDELQSLILQTEIALNTSEVNLGYTKINSPLDGTVVSVPVEAGQTVNANQTTPTIVQIADLAFMEIKIQISEGDITKVAPGMEVTYTILSEPEKVFHTTLRSIDPGLTTLTDGTYTGATDTSTAVYYYGKLRVPNEERKLRIGMTIQSTITISAARDVLVVPSIAVQERDGRHFVHVLDNGVPVEQEVTVGLSDTMQTEIRSGLREGQEVIASQMSQADIRAGATNARVRMRPPL